MTISKKFSEITSYQGQNFQNWFGSMEFVEKKSKLLSKKLSKLMTDEEIQKQFNPTELTLGEVFNYLKTEADKNDWMIFYCRDKDGVLRAVFVSWYDDGWDVLAYALDDYGWGDGRQVFSRNSFDTLTPELLEPSLEQAIEICKKAGYQVSKLL